MKRKQVHDDMRLSFCLQGPLGGVYDICFFVRISENSRRFRKDDLLLSRYSPVVEAHSGVVEIVGRMSYWSRVVYSRDLKSQS